IKYLGTLITPQRIRPQNLTLQVDVKTLHDVQVLVGSIQWFRGIVGIPNDLLSPLFDLLKGKNPWEP
ncbi:PO113 protein, partial [Piaya cayana]|nr:PO113 protein [Piaya cayana]